MKKVLLVIAVALCCVVFTGCNKDKDKTYTYEIVFGVSDIWWHGDATPEVEAWIQSIEAAYEQALGVNSTSFTKTGKEADCDQQVKDACKKAEPNVDAIQHLGDGKLTVNNITTGKEVYSYKVTRTTNK